MNRFTLSALLICGCATTAPERQSAAEAFGATKPASASDGAKPSRVVSTERAAAPRDLDKWAAGYRRPVECGVGAKELTRDYGRDLGWSALKACVNKGGFSLLKEVSEIWGEDLRTRSDASVVMAQIIATRGGNVGQDLTILQEKRVPLFELGAALRAPGTFKGRYVLFVGRISEVKNRKGKVELALNEMTLQGETSNVLVGRRYGSVGSASASASGRYGSTSASGSYSGSSSRVSGEVETRSTTEFVESGETALIRLKQADPFLSTERNFLFLVRFDGVVVSESEAEEEGRNTALGTLVAYFDVQTGAI